MTGVYLQGGGAKGAFQAGALVALHEAGFTFDVIAGTSIGAVNGYYVYADRFDQLALMWTDIDESSLSYIRVESNVIENDKLLDRLREIPVQSGPTTKFFVNYVTVRQGKVEEVFEDIGPLRKRDQLRRIGYSALLPKPKGMDLSPSTLETFDSRRLFEEFHEQVVRGEYEGMSLDGGIVNNHFLEPFVDHQVDHLILIPFQVNYQVPDFIQDVYRSDQITVIDPVVPFEPMDTLRFEKVFCSLQYEAGYKRAHEVLALSRQR